MTNDLNSSESSSILNQKPDSGVELADNSNEGIDFDDQPYEPETQTDALLEDREYNPA